MNASRDPRPRRRPIALAVALAALLSACGGGKTGGARLPWLWPMYQRTADRSGQAEVQGPVVGTVAWSATLESPASNLIVTESELLLVRHGEHLSAFTRDGEHRWSRKIGPGIGTPIALPEQFIFAPTDEGIVQGLTRDGATAFAHVLAGSVTSPAVRSNNDLVVAYASSATEGRVAILPPEPRPAIATLTCGPLGTASVALDDQDGLYVGSTNGSLYAFDIRRGLASPQALFTLALGTAITRGTPAVRDGVVYLVDDADQLHSVSRTGVLFWSFKPKVATTNGGGSTPAVHPKGYVIYGTQDQHVYALRADGSVAWSVDAGAAISSPPVIDGAGHIYVRTNAGVVVCLDGNGHRQFATDLHDTITSTFDAPLVLGADGSLFLTTQDARLVCLRDGPVWGQAGADARHTSRSAEAGPTRALLDASLPVAKRLSGPILVGTDGRLVTRLPSGAVIAFDRNHRPIYTVHAGEGNATPALLANDIVIVGSTQGTLTALSSTGTTLWQTDLGASVGATSIGVDGSIVVATDDGQVHWLRDDGTRVRSVAVDQVELAAPAFTADGDAVVSTRSGDVVRIDVAATITFRTSVGARVPGPIAVAGNDLLIALTEHDVLVAVDAHGQLAWFVDPAAGTATTGLGGPSLATDGTIWFGDASATLHAIAADGGVITSVALAEALAGPPAIDSFGRVYTAGVNGAVQGFAADGALLFTVPGPTTSSEGKASGPSLARGGQLVVGTSSGLIDILSDRDPWPALGGSVARAGTTSISGPIAPRVAWQFTTANDATPAPVVSSDGRIYARTLAGALIALTGSGQEIWHKDIGAGSSAPLLTRDGRVMCSTDGGRLAATNRSGKVAWFLELGERLTSPVEDADGTLIVAGTKHLFVASGDGKLIASVTAADSLAAGSPALSSNGELAVATTHDTLLVYAVDALRNGIASPTLVVVPGPVSRSTPAFDRRGRLYVLTDRDQLSAFTIDGSPIFTFDPGFASEQGGVGGPVIAANGVAYFAAQDGRLFVVDANGNGSSIYQTPAPALARPIIDGNGVLYLAVRGVCYGVTSTGSEVFPPLTLDASLPALGALAISLQGRLVVGGASGAVYQVRD